MTSDSHGGCKALQQCLEKSGFDKEQDLLIFLGDVVDGWPETKESIDLLLTVRNLVYLLGNHDQWAMNYYAGKMDDVAYEQELWLSQGGEATVASYGVGKQMPQEHLTLLQQAKLFHLTKDNKLFVHAGFDTHKPLEATDAHYLLWDRSFVSHYYKLHRDNMPFTIAAYQEVYIGHTPTIALSSQQTLPLRMGNIILTDTGAAFTGRLSILDIDSKEVWQSDPVMTLYPDSPGRNGISWNELKGKASA